MIKCSACITSCWCSRALCQRSQNTRHCSKCSAEPPLPGHITRSFHQSLTVISVAQQVLAKQAYVTAALLPLSGSRLEQLLCFSICMLPQISRRRMIHRSFGAGPSPRCALNWARQGLQPGSAPAAATSALLCCAQSALLTAWCGSPAPPAGGSKHTDGNMEYIASFKHTCYGVPIQA
jgi:hypothetical protein